MSLLEVRDLTTSFRTANGEITAVEDVSFDLEAGEILGIVGESGSGKSVTALTIMGLLPRPPARIRRGSIGFNGQDLLTLSDRAMQRLRGPGMAMVFQEPMTSLNPVLTIGQQIIETVQAHERLSGRDAFARAVAMLDKVGIPSASSRMSDYPHQLSGGQRQRVMLAIALVCRPQLLIADEPTTALDVTIQAQILDLIMDLRDEFGMAVMLITHNMGVIAETADRVMVMYAGRVVEQAPVADLFDQPRHPYTRGLLACVPTLDQEQSRLIAIPGNLPEPARRPEGCRFRGRCGFEVDACASQTPPLRLLAPANAVTHSTGQSATHPAAGHSAADPASHPTGQSAAVPAAHSTACIRAEDIA
jgi:oligopeptide/dipeptide ABC transporter ATP-binding protein